MGVVFAYLGYRSSNSLRFRQSYRYRIALLYTAEQRCQLLVYYNAVVGYRVLFACPSVLYRHKLCDGFVVRSAEYIRFCAFLAVIYRYLLLIYLVALAVITLKHLFYLCRLFIGHCIVISGNTGIIAYLAELLLQNIVYAVIHAESRQHKRRTTCNAHYRHKHSSLIAEYITHRYLIAERKPVPYKAYAFKQYLLTALWCFRPHKRRRTVVKYAAAREIDRNSSKQYSHSCGTYHKYIVIRQKNIGDNVHHSVCGNNDRREYLHSHKHTRYSARRCRCQCIKQIFEYNSAVFIAERLERSYLSTLFLYHSCHRGKTYKRRHHYKEQGEHHSYIAYSFGILTVFTVARVIITGKQIPLRSARLFELFPAIVYLLLSIGKLLVRIGFCRFKSRLALVIFLQTLFIIGIILVILRFTAVILCLARNILCVSCIILRLPCVILRLCTFVLCKSACVLRISVLVLFFSVLIFGITDFVLQLSVIILLKPVIILCKSALILFLLLVKLRLRAVEQFYAGIIRLFGDIALLVGFLQRITARIYHCLLTCYLCVCIVKLSLARL